MTTGEKLTNFDSWREQLSSSDFEDGDEDDFALVETAADDSYQYQTDGNNSDWMMKPSSALSFDKLANSVKPSKTPICFGHMGSRVTPLSPMIGK